MPNRIRFGVYEIDREAMELRRHGVPIRLQEQPFRVLAMLVDRPGEVVTREQLQAQIWGDTFVDFDQSLNKAINRVREALHDNAATPQYIETVPRRGYRFIAPVTSEVLTPACSAISRPEVQDKPNASRYANRVSLLAASVVAIALAAVSIAVILLRSWPTHHAVLEAKRINSFGVFPTLSGDGKVMAFMSSLGGGTPRVWVQQTAGSQAIPVTPDSYPALSPEISPDGTRIAFVRYGVGIFVAPALPGDPRLLLADPEADSPHFSPDGKSILYKHDRKAFFILIDGGQPVELPLNNDFQVYGNMLWAPSGKEIMFYGFRSDTQSSTARWWIAPVLRGEPRPANLPAGEPKLPVDKVRAWARDANGVEWLIYSAGNPERWELWRVGVSTKGATDHNPELLVSGNGHLGDGGSLAEDGKLAYNLWNSSTSLFQISIQDRGREFSLSTELPLADGADYSSPSLSHDGKWMAYTSFAPSRPGSSVLLRDMSAGTEHLLDDEPRPGGNGETSISADGSTVVFDRDCKHGTFPNDPNSPLPCGFMIAAAGGQPKQICEDCTPRGFSSNGSVILLQKYDLTEIDKSRIVALDLRTGKQHEFLSLPNSPLFHAYFSWDDRWVVFKKSQSLHLVNPMSQIMIAPVRGGLPRPQSEWIEVTNGQYADDKPQFSPDGNTAYFTSTRDGALCIWAQRLNPQTKRPLGQPFALEHFHDAAGRAGAFYQGDSDLTVARDKMLISLPRVHSDTWMVQIH